MKWLYNDSDIITAPKNNPYNSLQIINYTNLPRLWVHGDNNNYFDSMRGESIQCKSI